MVEGDTSNMEANSMYLTPEPPPMTHTSLLLGW